MDKKFLYGNNFWKLLVFTTFISQVSPEMKNQEDVYLIYREKESLLGFDSCDYGVLSPQCGLAG